MTQLRECTIEKERTELQDLPTYEEKLMTEAERMHNEQISERYRQLKNIVDDQFATRTIETPTQHHFANNAPAYQTYSYAPTVEQNPQVTEYIRNLKASIYQTENCEVQAPVMQQEIAEPVVVNEMKTTMQESYSLTALGKVVVGVFAVVVISMMVLIGANTNTLAQKSMRIDELQMQRQTLLEQNAEVERRIAEAKSEETIRQYAESQGMIEID